jgi:phage-related holin
MLSIDTTIYDPIDEAARPLLPVYLIIASFAIFITVQLIIKWRERRTEATKWLSLAFSMYSFLIIVITIGFLEMYITGYKMEIYRFSLAAGYSGLMIANCFLIRFAVFIFGKEEKQGLAKFYIAVSLVIAVLVALPLNYYGIPDAIIPPEHRNYRMIFSGLMMLFSVFTYSRIFREAMRVSHKIDDRWAATGMKMIALSQISLIGFFVCTLLDTLTFTFTDSNGYTIFIYFAWVLTGLFLFFSYLGLIMPPWFRNWLENVKKK